MLLDSGVVVGDRVGLLIEPSVHQAVGILGVSKAGAAFVPVDPGWPFERQREVLLDAGARVVVSTPTAGADRHALSVILAPRGDGLAMPPPTSVAGTDVAHVFYTSGSTGKPKGVLVEHRSIVNRLAWAAEAYALTPADRALVLPPMTFDPFLWLLLCPLMVGGSAIIASDEERTDPEALAALLHRGRVTVTEFVPAMLLRCLGVPALGRAEDLRTIVCASETVPVGLPAKVHEVLPGCHVYNAFGPTETTIDSLWWHCDPAVGGEVPVGLPIANTTVHVVDRHLCLVPIGVPGEICIGGLGVARGYLHRPDESGRAFVPDPYAGGDARLYRTGDRGYRREDGAIMFLGRADRQVKVNGVRVEPGEVEEALRAHPDVVDAAVVAIEDRNGLTRLAAFVVAADLDAPAVRTHAARRLPTPFIPSRIVMLDRMPVDHNGKVDRRRLVEAARDTRPATAGVVPPRTPCQKRLHEIWAEVLGIDDFGVTDSFFDLGGDSILSMQVVAMARRGGMRLAARDLYAAQTIEALEGVVEAASSAPAAVPAPRQSIVAPLAPAQRWFIDQRFADADHFNDALLLRLRRGTDAEVLLDALAVVVERHPELGARFEGGANCREQRFDRVPTIAVDRRSLSGLTHEALVEAREEAAQAAHASLDLRLGRLGRGVLFDQDGTRELMLLFHHLVIDAVSWRTLLRELAEAHDALAAGEGATNERGASFGSWIERMVSHTRGGGLDAAADIWARQPVGRLTIDRDPSPLVGDSQMLRTSIDPETTRQLLRQAARSGRRRFDAVLLSGLLRALRPWSAADRITLEVEGHGRDVAGAEALNVLETVGWFTSLFPVSVEMPDGAGPRAALGAVEEQLSVIPQNGDSFGWLRYYAPDRRTRVGLAAIGEPEVAFNYAGQFDHIARSHGSFVQQPYPPGRLQSSRARRTRLLEVNSFILGGTLHIEWSCDGSPAIVAMTREVAVSMTSNLEELAGSDRG